MTTETLVREVGRCALNIEPADRLLCLLEEYLFSDIIPKVEESVVPAVIGRALLQLYLELRRGADAHVTARTVFDEIRFDSEGRTFCPVEAVIAGLEDAAASRQVCYAEAKELSSLPWSEFWMVVPEELAVSGENFRIEVGAILHEVEDGFVDPSTGYPELALAAATLAAELRARISELYPAAPSE